MDYISWIGLEGTEDYETNIGNVPSELARKNYAASAAGNHYTHNCTN